MANARDEQVIRETVLQGNPNLRDHLVFREAIILTVAQVTDFQVFREAIILRPVSSARTPVLFAVT
jgi:hypothetical protein